MQMFKYVTLTLCQQQLQDDVVLPPRGKQRHLSKGPKEEGEFNTKLLHVHGKA